MLLILPSAVTSRAASRDPPVKLLLRSAPVPLSAELARVTRGDVRPEGVEEPEGADEPALPDEPSARIASGSALGACDAMACEAERERVMRGSAGVGAGCDVS